MLGFYENFPTFYHAKANFTCASLTKTLQEVIIKTANQLNCQEYDLNTITPKTLANCKISFEFGIAENATFNYLTEKEIERFWKFLSKKENATNIDFLCVVKYYLLVENEKPRPLKFDYYLLRFIFQKPNVELRIFHERGTQRFSIEELVEFLTRQINIELAKIGAKPLKLKTLMHPVPIEKL